MAEAAAGHAAAADAGGRSTGLPAALALTFASGCAALGCQMVWTQQLSVWLGHEAAAVLAVIAAFFGGVALGAHASSTRVEASAHPGRWLAACEAVIGLWALGLPLVIPHAGAWLLRIIGEQPAVAWQWSAAFAGTFVLLLPATLAMGATLPALERLLAERRRRRAAVAPLYGANTAGAVAGVLVTTFVLVPAYGLARTALLCGAISLACAAVAWASWRHPIEAAPAPAPRASDAAAAARWRLAATGLLGIGYEVTVVRMLGQVAENTVYTYAMLLAVYLAGTAAGAAAHARGWGGAGDADRRRDALLLALALACLAGAAGLWWAPDLKAAVLDATGGGYAAALGAEAALAVVAFGPATVLMGALFSHLAATALAGGSPLGRSLGINTLGAALAPAVYGAGLAPWAGAPLAVVTIVVGYLALRAPARRHRPAAAAVAGAALAWGTLVPATALVDVPPGGRLVERSEGALGVVTVVEDANGVATLHIDNRQPEGSSATRHADARQAWLPLLLHDAPRRALFIGLGTGTTARSAAADPALQVEAVELLPEVVRASAHFVATDEDRAAAERLRVVVADARRHVRVATQPYDVIVADNVHPARRGSAGLLTVEHFAAVRERLAPGGLHCQWLPLHQLDLPTLRSIVRGFLLVFPDATAVLATHSLQTPVIGLVGRVDGAALDPARVRSRIAAVMPRVDLAALGLQDDLAVTGSFVAGPAALARFAAQADANTDDRPLVAYRAPRATLAPESDPGARLLAWLASLRAGAPELPPLQADRGEHERLAAYLQARDRFLVAGRGVRPTADPRAMLRQVREPLLDVLRTSAEFRPAYDPLLRMAIALSRDDPVGARGLLLELQRLQPSRPEAARELERLAGAR